MTPPTIEFLGFDGCPNTPQLREALDEADLGVTILEVDLMKLQMRDQRLGWGAPTILVDGEDLFGLERSEGSTVSCRNWNQGLPTSTEIKQAMKERQ